MNPTLTLLILLLASSNFAQFTAPVQEQERQSFNSLLPVQVGGSQEQDRTVQERETGRQEIVELQEQDRALRQEIAQLREREQALLRELQQRERVVEPEQEQQVQQQEVRRPPAPRDETLCNPVTGFRARNGGVYAAFLNGLGVRPGNCGRGAEVETPPTRPSNVETDQQQRPVRAPSGPINPITGIRARPGGVYARLLNAAGVQNDNGEERREVGPARAPSGPVNPITGIRAQPGGIYARLLNAAGVQNDNGEGRRGVGLFGNSRLVQAINARGGLIAFADQNSAMPSQQSATAAAIPSWHIAVIVLACVVAVALIAVVVQLVFLLRRL